MAPCALICWLTAERQHCLFNVRRVKGHCIAFVRSAVEVTLSSGPSCCRQLGHATYIESNYPCQLITAQLVPSQSTDTHKIPCYTMTAPPCTCMSFNTYGHTKSLEHTEVQREKAANKTNQFKSEQFKAEQCTLEQFLKLTKWHKVEDCSEQFLPKTLIVISYHHHKLLHLELVQKEVFDTECP